MSNRLYIGNLPYTTTEDELREAFEPFGTVVSSRIITDRETGRSRGFGFVEMSTDEEANKALSGMNGAAFGGRTLKVDLARPRDERGDRGGSRRGQDNW